MDGSQKIHFVKPSHSVIMYALFMISSFVSLINTSPTNSNRKYYDTGVQLPEIIINEKPKNDFSGYQYPIPAFPPVFLDETTQNPVYLPPPSDIPQGNISNDYPDYSNPYLPPVTLEPPLFDPPVDDEDTIVIPLPPTNSYLPPDPNVKNQHLAPSDHSARNQLRVVNMSCLNQRYFRAGIQMTVRNLVPVIESGSGDCLAVNGDVYRLDFSGRRMRQCGVRDCGDGNMCVQIRVPLIRGLRLADDMNVVLQCRPQERVVSNTKHLKFNAQSM